MEEERLGLITNMNKSFVHLFGYIANELVNKYITNIIPDLFSKTHNEILKKYLETNILYNSN